MRRVRIKVESINFGPNSGDLVVVEGETTQLYVRHEVVSAPVQALEARRGPGNSHVAQGP